MRYYWKGLIELLSSDGIMGIFLRKMEVDFKMKVKNHDLILVI